MSLLDVVKLADSLSPELELKVVLSPSEERGLPLRVGEQDTLVGFVNPRVLEDVKRDLATFQVREDAVRFAASLSTPDLRSAAIDSFFRQLRAENKYPCLRGWRGEVYAVYGSEEDEGGIAPTVPKATAGCRQVASAVPAENVRGDQFLDSGEERSKGHSRAIAQRKPLFLCERAAAGLLGLRSYGCHLNGYIRLESGLLKMWISRRSRSKATYPGMLDNLVGGGMAAGMLPFDNLIKECGEEAGIPEELALQAIPMGAITFFMQDEERGWIPDTEYVYDLQLDCSFLPKAVDGEVEEFLLLDYNTVLKHVLMGEFMPESALVVIDFFIRHRYIHPANEPDYLEIISRIHRRHLAPGPKFRSTELGPRSPAGSTVPVAGGPSRIPLVSAATSSGSVNPTSKVCSSAREPAVRADVDETFRDERGPNHGKI